MSDEWDVAIHEAGHAVASVQFARGIKWATIEPAEGALGHVQSYRLTTLVGRLEEADYACTRGGFIDARTRRSVETEIIVNLAGGRSQIEYAEGATDEDVLPGMGGDYGYCVELAEKVSGGEDERDAYLRWLEARTANMVRDPLFGSTVEAVAEELCRKRTLTGKEIRAVVERAKDDERKRMTEAVGKLP